MARDPLSRPGRDGTAGGGGGRGRGTRTRAGALGLAAAVGHEVGGNRRLQRQAPSGPRAWGHDGAKVPGPSRPACGGSWDPAAGAAWGGGLGRAQPHPEALTPLCRKRKPRAIEGEGTYPLGVVESAEALGSRPDSSPPGTRGVFAGGPGRVASERGFGVSAWLRSCSWRRLGPEDEFGGALPTLGTRQRGALRALGSRVRGGHFSVFRCPGVVGKELKSVSKKGKTSSMGV